MKTIICVHENKKCDEKKGNKNVFPNKNGRKNGHKKCFAK